MAPQACNSIKDTKKTSRKYLIWVNGENVCNPYRIISRSRYFETRYNVSTG
jgi:hypothetical protein